MAISKSPLVTNESPTQDWARTGLWGLRSGLRRDRRGVGVAAGRPSRALSRPPTSFLAGFAHAMALALGDDDDRVVQETIGHGGGGGVLGQVQSPRLERPVAGDTEGPSLASDHGLKDA